MKSSNIRITRIEPNKGFWNKPPEYYKEYISYVNAYNKALDEKFAKPAQQPTVETPKTAASS